MLDTNENNKVSSRNRTYKELPNGKFTTEKYNKWNKSSVIGLGKISELDVRKLGIKQS